MQNPMRLLLQEQVDYPSEMKLIFNVHSDLYFILSIFECLKQGVPQIIDLKCILSF